MHQIEGGLQTGGGGHAKAIRREKRLLHSRRRRG
jgi:hypothetical protein